MSRFYCGLEDGAGAVRKNIKQADDQRSCLLFLLNGKSQPVIFIFCNSYILFCVMVSFMRFPASLYSSNGSVMDPMN